jgi:DNA-binding response OmpR family regulator
MQNIQNTGLGVTPWVAIAEDESPSREGLARVLSDDGYEVDCYSTAESMLEALGRARACGRSPALILTDIPRPGWLELRVLRELRRQGYRVPIVLMTACGSEEMLNDAFALGASIVLSKPFPAHDLLRIVGCFIPSGRGQCT